MKKLSFCKHFNVLQMKHLNPLQTTLYLKSESTEKNPECLSNNPYITPAH